MKQDILLLIDGSSLLSTQFYGNLPREILFAKTEEEKAKYFNKIMMTRTGVYTNAVFGFLRTLLKILKDQEPAYLAVAWDLTRDTFRREMYPAYKGNRSETMKPLSDQFELCQRVLKEIGIAQFSDLRYEADDFCGTLSKAFEDQVPVRIMTKDRDYLQLVSAKTHLWFMHTTAEKTEELYRKYGIDHTSLNVPDRTFELDPRLVEAEYGVKPEHINSLKGLEGDASDNIPGVAKIGEKTAVPLIQEYGTVTALYDAIRDLDKKGQEEIKKYWKDKLGIRSALTYLLKTSDTELCGEEAALLSEKLATIFRDIPLGDLKLEALKTEINEAGLMQIFDELELQSIKKEYTARKVEKISYKDTFTEIEDLSGFSALMEKAAKAGEAGIEYVPEIGISVCLKDGTCTYIPVRFFITDREIINFLHKLQDKKVKLYTFEGKRYVKNAGVSTVDMEIAAYLLDPLAASYPYEAVAAQYLDETFPSKEALIGKLSLKKANEEMPEKVKEYCCYAALTALKAAPVLMEKLKETGMLSLYQDIELPVMAALARMEQAGILVKQEELKAYGKELEGQITKLEQEIYEAAGEVFNINSPKQLSAVLFEHMNIPYPVKAKKGTYSTSADILDRLKDHYPVISQILEYRTYTKLRSTYAEGLQEWISEDGRIHGEFNQTVTATGRLSSTNPNLQNIPARIELGRLIRKVFVPQEGCILIDADYSQIELRVLAHLSGDETLINAYQSAKDIHAITASQVFHVPLDQVTPLQRRNAKAVNFGIVYGISAFALGEDLGISKREADEYMERYFETYPAIRTYLEKCVADAYYKGYITTMYGRRREIKELKSANFQQRSFGERVAMNSPIQGTAADIMKIAMINVDKRLKEEKLKSRIVLQVHDELLVEAPLEEADLAEKILTEEMEHAADLKVKLAAEAKRGNTWYETK